MQRKGLAGILDAGTRLQDATVAAQQAADRVCSIKRTEWPEPLPLVPEVSRELYPLDALPDTIRAAVEEVQDFTKAPASMVAGSALAAVSVAVQAHVDVKRAEKLTGPVSVFLLTIADSGERKSTCDTFFTKAIRDYERVKAAAAKPDIANYKASIEVWDAKRAGCKEKTRQLAKGGKETKEVEDAMCELEKEKPEPPKVPRLLYADATPEALAYGLANKWPSGGVVSAEAGIVLGSHGMSHESAMRNLGLLNTLWDGGTLTVDRRSAESFTVRGARLTIALQIQEAALQSFLDRTGTLARGTGFLARFLLAWPESTQGFRPFTEAPTNWPALAAFNQRVTEILNQDAPIDDEGALTPIMLPLMGDAKTAWIAFHDAIEGGLAYGGELYDVRDVASKTADNAARLAALFQFFEGPASSIGAKAFESASRVAAWHLNEALRFFGELALPAGLADAVRLDLWLIDYCRRKQTHIVPRRDVQQNVTPVRLRQKAALDDALRELTEAGRIALLHQDRRKEIHVNPALIERKGA